MSDMNSAGLKYLWLNTNPEQCADAWEYVKQGAQTFRDRGYNPYPPNTMMSFLHSQGFLIEDLRQALMKADPDGYGAEQRRFEAAGVFKDEQSPKSAPKDVHPEAHVDAIEAIRQTNLRVTDLNQAICERLEVLEHALQLLSDITTSDATIARREIGALELRTRDAVTHNQVVEIVHKFLQDLLTLRNTMQDD